MLFLCKYFHFYVIKLISFPLLLLDLKSQEGKSHWRLPNIYAVCLFNAQTHLELVAVWDLALVGPRSA